VSQPAEQSKLAPNGRPVRPFVMPASLGGKLGVWRFILYRRLVQLGVLLIFYGTAHWGWEVAGRPPLVGNLSSSRLLDAVPMADPFAVLQISLTGVVLEPRVWLGAGIVLLGYLLVGGRAWCAWVCPVNLVTDLTGWLRRRLPVYDLLYLNRNLRYTVLVLSLALSLLAGVAAFEWISPIGMLHRELIFGMGLGWVAVLGIFLFDLLVLRHGWCGHLCPLGAFYALVGRLAPVRVRFDTPTCTRCGECAKVCPEPQVLNLRSASAKGMIASGECTNCGRCITVCPESTLSFGLRMPPGRAPDSTANRPRQRSPS